MDESQDGRQSVTTNSQGNWSGHPHITESWSYNASQWLQEKISNLTLDYARKIRETDQFPQQKAAMLLSDNYPPSTPWPLHYDEEVTTLDSYYFETTDGWFENSSDFSNFTNSTDFISSHSPFEVALISIIVTVLCVITAGGNLLVMISFKMDKQLQTVSNYFLLSLSVADFFIGLFSMPLYTVYLLMDRWPLGPLVCDIWLSLDYTMSNASVANLLVISFDRYLSVTRPLTYRANRTPKRAAIMISCAWIISALMWTPWIFAWPYIEGQRTVPHDECYIQFLESNQYITMVTAIAAFYCPVVIMGVLYFKIFLETEKRQKGLSKLQATKQTGHHRYNKTAGDSSDDDVYVRLSKRSDSSPDMEDIDEYEVLSSRHGRRWKCIRKLRTCCRIDRETEYMDDSSSSDPPGSPGNYEGTPTSTQQSRGVSIRKDNSGQNHRVHQNGKHDSHRDSSSQLMIPLINVDSNKSSPIATPSTEITGTFSRTSNLSSAADMQIAEGEVHHHHSPIKEEKKGDMYTILIKLPDEKSNPGAKPTIRMIPESEADEEVDDTMGASYRGNSFPMTCRRMQSDTSDQISVTSSTLGRQDSVVKTPEMPSIGRKLTQSTETMRIAMQARIAAKLAAKVKVQRARKKRQERKQEKKAAKTLSAILLAFIITWTPYNLFTVIEAFCTGSCINQTIYAIGYWLCYINSTVNPVCYALCNANFRRTYWRILTCRYVRRRRNPMRGIYETSTYMSTHMQHHSNR